MVDANTLFTAAQLNDMKELIKVNEELKILEAKKKTLYDNVKGYMSSINVNECSVNGVSFKMIDSVRRMIGKNQKNEFVAALVGMNKQYLLITSIEPDLDGIFAEVDAGTISKDFVDTYIKTTAIKTLRVN